MKHRTQLQNAVKWLIAAIGSLIVILPVYFIVINSLKTYEESAALNFKLPEVFQWANYLRVIEEGNLIRAFGNSMLISGASVLICLIASAMTAFVINRNKTWFHKILSSYYFLGLIAPVNYVATIYVLKILHLQNTYPGIILVNAAVGIPFIVFLYSSFLDGVPAELDEAAIIDGAGSIQLFFRIIFPLLRPVTVTGFVLNFLGAWNDFVTPLYLLNDTNKLGMVNSIYNFFGQYFNEWNMIFANIILSVAPILILYIFGQKYIVSGTTAGAVKG